MKGGYTSLDGKLTISDEQSKRLTAAAIREVDADVLCTISVLYVCIFICMYLCLIVQCTLQCVCMYASVFSVSVVVSVCPPYILCQASKRSSRFSCWRAFYVNSYLDTHTHTAYSSAVCRSSTLCVGSECAATYAHIQQQRRSATVTHTVALSAILKACVSVRVRTRMVVLRSDPIKATTHVTLTWLCFRATRSPTY